jgi:hypothetical protein
MRQIRVYLTARWNADIADVDELLRAGSLLDGLPDHEALVRRGPGQIDLSVRWEDARVSVWLVPQSRDLLEAGLALTADAPRALAPIIRRAMRRKLGSLESPVRLRVEAAAKRRAISATRRPAAHGEDRRRHGSLA